jgi:hypothetical protein
MQDKMIYTNIKGFYKSPCLAFIHNQIYCLGFLDEQYIPFEELEWFARCGVVKRVDYLNSLYERLLSHIDENLNINYKINPYSRNWQKYSGFALEADWKSKIRKQCDLLFRILLIIHYAERNY